MIPRLRRILWRIEDYGLSVALLFVRVTVYATLPALVIYGMIYLLFAGDFK